MIKVVESFVNDFRQFQQEESLTLDKQSNQIYQSLCQKISNQKLRICIVSLAKSGKTTLINAMLGEQFLHISNKPATCGITYISHQNSKESKLFKLNENGTRGELLGKGCSGEIFDAVGKVNQQLREMAQENAQGTVLSTGDIELELLAPMLCLQDVPEEKTSRIQIVDTPGRNEATNEMVRRISDDCVTTADVIVFVFNYNSPNTNDEKQMWTYLAQSRSELLKTKSDRIYYVINQFDNKSSTGLGEQDMKLFVQKYVNDYCGFKPPLENMFCISARNALYSRCVLNNSLKQESSMFNDIVSTFFPYKEDVTLEQVKNKNFAEILKKSNFVEFEKRVIEHITDISWKIFEESVMEMANKFTSNMIQILEVELNQHKKSIEENIGDVKKLEKVKQQIEVFIQEEFNPWFKTNVESEMKGLIDNFLAGQLQCAKNIEKIKIPKKVFYIKNDQSEERALKQATEYARKILSEVVIQHFARLVASNSQCFSISLEVLSRGCNEHFKKLLLEKFNPMITNTMKQHNLGNININFEYPSDNPINKVIQEIINFTNLNWEQLLSNLDKYIQQGEEICEEIENEPTEVAIDIMVPKVRNAVRFFFGKVEINYEKATKRIQLMKPVKRKKKYNAFTVEPEVIVGSALELFKKEIKDKQSWVNEFIPSLLMDSIGGVWKQHLTVSTEVTIQSIERILSQKRGNNSELCNARSKSRKLLQFFKKKSNISPKL